MNSGHAQTARPAPAPAGDGHPRRAGSCGSPASSDRPPHPLRLHPRRHRASVLCRQRPSRPQSRTLFIQDAFHLLPLRHPLRVPAGARDPGQRRYHWFLGLALTDRVTDDFAVSQNRRRRYSGSDIEQTIFDRIVAAAIELHVLPPPRKALRLYQIVCTTSLVDCCSNRQLATPEPNPSGTRAKSSGGRPERVLPFCHVGKIYRVFQPLTDPIPMIPEEMVQLGSHPLCARDRLGGILHAASRSCGGSNAFTIGL